MASIEKYAIKHKPTGHYLPEPKGRMGRGGSHVEPVKVIQGQLATYPRMFPTKRGAENCLAQWLRGKHHAEYEYESDEPGGRQYRIDAGTSIEHVPTRIREEMEVVTLVIEL